MVTTGESNWSPENNVFETKTRPRWYETIDSPRDLALVPLKGYYVHNGLAEVLFKARLGLPENFTEVEELSWAVYYKHYYYDMRTQEAMGLDVKDDRLEFWEAVSRLPEELRQEVKEALCPRVTQLLRRRQWLELLRYAYHSDMGHSIISSPSLRRKLHSLVDWGGKIRARSKWPVTVSGDKAGFSNILECARQLEAICATIETSKEAVS